jgi:hypothetical protein
VAVKAARPFLDINNDPQTEHPMTAPRVTPAPAPPPPTTAPASPAKGTDWTALLSSKTFWGVVIASLGPLVLGWAGGTAPTLLQDVTAAGTILAGAGLRDVLGRIESWLAAVVTGLQNANIPPK